MRNPNNASKPAQNTTNTNVPPANNGAPTPEAYAALLAKVQELEAKANRKARMEAGATTDHGLKLAVSVKGALSVYGLGRFPVTLYREQMERLLADAKDILQFIADNPTLVVKEKAEKEEQAAA